jgi:NAD+ kinase
MTAKKLALFGGSFNPPGLHHRGIAEALCKTFEEVVVIPCGPRPDKPFTDEVAPIYRAAMVDMTFQQMPKVRIELFDLEAGTFTRTFELDERFRSLGEIWHVVGSDLIQGGKKGSSPIQREWFKGDRLWKEARFAVCQRPGFPIEPSDLPPRSQLIEVNDPGASSTLREKIYHHQSMDGLVSAQVASYINRHGLYRGTQSPRAGKLSLEDLRPLVVSDPGNPEAQRIATDFGPSNEKDPNLIIVIGGDGAMLRAIRRYWRRRIPFYGINAGHLGFLLNQNSQAPLMHRELVVWHLPLLWVQVETADGKEQGEIAFNDAWVERATGQASWIRVEVNGQERIPQLVGDAALVSTAAGSASYARAMGAPALPFNTPTLLLTGSNVLKPFGWKSAALPLDTSIKFTTLDAVKRPLNGFIDGVSLGSVHGITVRVSNIASVELAFDPEYDPAEKLAHIQFPEVG